MSDYKKTENVDLNKNSNINPELETLPKNKYKQKSNINNKYIQINALLFAVLITISLSILIHQGISNANNIFNHETILDEPELLKSLRSAQDDNGVNIAIHGWMHENFSEITPEEAAADLEKSKYVFEKAGFKSGLFVAPFEIFGTPEKSEARELIKKSGFYFGTTKEPIYEYTWLWRDLKSVNDPRFQEATSEITKTQPEYIVFHAQDWNEYTEQLLVNYLTSTNTKNITLRMDDIGVNTPKEVIDGAAKLRQYKSVDTIIFSVIPAGIRDVNDPEVFNIKVKNIMDIYFLFFIITALLPLSFFVFWKLLSSWYFSSDENDQCTEKSDGYPKLVSVIVPAYNEEKSIGRCIEALLSQDYDGAVEIIVINDGSSDRTAEIVMKYPVTLIDLKKNGGKANALNRGIEESKGDVIVFTDSDSNMAKETIRSLVNTFRYDSEAQMATGNVLINTPEKSSLIKRILIYCQMIEYHLEQEISRYLQGLGGKILVCPGPSTAVRRNICEVVRYSDDTIVEDADFTIKVLEKSIKVVRNPQAKVYTNAPETLLAWYKQRKRWWFGYLQVWRKHKQWSKVNAWMIYNYMSYIISVCSVIMILLIPYFLFLYDNMELVAFRGILYITIPVLMYIMFTGIFFRHDKKLLPMLIPYVIIYSILRIFVLSYVYICYLTRRGLKIKFGSRMISAK